MDAIFSFPTEYFAASDGLLTSAGIILGICLILGLIGRGIFGVNSSLTHALSSAVGILFIYALSVVILVFEGSLSRFQEFLTPLPFVQIQNDHLQIFSVSAASQGEICQQILSMVILAFLFNLIDGHLPKGENLFTWIFFRLATVLLSMAAHYAFYSLVGEIPSSVITENAPTILLILLVLMLCVGALKFVVGIALATVNPLIGILYTFFFANVVGKQLSKAVLTSGILTALAWSLDYFHALEIPISASILPGYVPFLSILAVIWYILNRVL